MKFMELEDVYDSATISHYREVLTRSTDPRLERRLMILAASGPYTSGYFARQWPKRCRAKRAAWSNYIAASDACSLFAGDDGRDLLARLRSEKDDQFRGALAECFACWFLAGVQKLKVKRPPRQSTGRRPDFIFEVNSQSIFVEVKAPFRPLPENTEDAYFGTDADVLQYSVDEANKQLSKNSTNVVILVPDIRDPVFMDRYQIEEAVYGQQGVVVRIDKRTKSPLGDAEPAFFPDGKFLKFHRAQSGPRFTRIGAVVVIEEDYEEFIDHAGREAFHVKPRILVAHNPQAILAVSPSIFSTAVQCLPVGETMQWNDLSVV